MDTLKFNRDLARGQYLRRYERLKFNKKKLELLLFRDEFLSRNPLFIQDWRELNKQSHKDDYRDKCIAFQKKWNIEPTTGLYFLLNEREPIVKFKGGEFNSDGEIDRTKIIISIDLRYSKKKIMQELKSIVDDYHSYYNEEFRQPYFLEYTDGSREKFIDHKVPCGLKGNIPKDLEDYDRYLKVWNLRELEGKSPSEIEKKLDISADTAKNWYNAACKLIKNGIPGFPPFPRE